MGKTTREVDDADHESPRTTFEEVNQSKKKTRFHAQKVTVSDFAELEELHRKCTLSD